MSVSGTYARIDRPTILFADADSTTRFAYHSIATAAGFCVELARDGYEALALANFVAPDIVVTEALLAGHDGFEIIRLLRANPRTRAIPVVIVSSEDGARFDAAVRASGCNGHLTKPCSAKSLLRLVEVLLIDRRRHGSRAAPSSGRESSVPTAKDAS